VEFLYIRSQLPVVWKKPPTFAKEAPMAFQQPLAPELEKQAHELVARLRQQTDEELLALARLLVSKEDQDLFGDTEFEVRDIVHRIGAKAFQTRLAEKKTATTVRASSAATVSTAPSSTATARPGA
jgi:hypothetical protein